MPQLVIPGDGHELVGDNGERRPIVAWVYDTNTQSGTPLVVDENDQLGPADENNHRVAPQGKPPYRP